MLTAPMNYSPPEKTGKLTESEMVEFLRQPWNARLATVTPEGRPYVTPVWFAYDADKHVFYVIARERSSFVPHLRQNPAVTLHMADDVHLAHTRVLVEGDADLGAEPVVPADDPWLRDMVNDMAVRYMGPDGPRYASATLDRPRILITITPRRTTSWTGGEWAAQYRR